MPISTRTVEGDLSAPATRGELFLVKTELVGKIDQVATELNGKVDQVATELNGKIDRVEASLKVEMKEMQLGLVRMMWIAVGTLGAVGILLQFF